jgi:deoxyribodipyrimidine photolyase-related protein
MILRLVLGDQLNSNHSWFNEKNNTVHYFMAEMRQETDYVTHHIQKIVGFFKSMRSFSESLKKDGHQITYYKLNDKNNTQNLTENLQQLIDKHGISKFEYQLPDEYRLNQQLKEFCEELKIESKVYDTEHFYTSREELTEFYEGKKQFTMEYFYRHMRKKHDIMMVNEKDPEGGKWNYDESNRNKWKGEPTIPKALNLNKDVSEIVSLLKKEKVKFIGEIKEKEFPWPTTRKESLKVLDYFCEHLLKHFGDYQDAMDPEEAFLFHSRLSYSLNSKMITPKEVIEKVIDHWKSNKDVIHISQVEGFVRQILGWREYMRGMYWKLMPNYQNENKLDCQNPLPDFYWTGETKMNCLKSAITNSLENAYAHHIQRLMITGNYALLTQTNPDEVDAWYLGIYIDAIQWVEITNTRGMSQWADGGIIATKPYVSSGSYINKMSNYCKDCLYKVSKKTEEDACPFNSLYWNFIDEKQEHFKDNNRMAMMLSLLQKMDKKTLEAHKKRAQHIIENPHEY